MLPAAASAQVPAPERSATRPAAAGAQLDLDYSSGPIGSPVTLSGRGFRANATVDLVWQTTIGSRVAVHNCKQGGWDEKSVGLGTVQADGSGAFSHKLTIPAPDVGGAHALDAIVSGKKVASTSYTIVPAAVSLGRDSGPAGTMFNVHLTGAGWTETANIYTFVYDNSYIGYGCGFNSRGDITAPLYAVGQPGWRFVDVYPAIYKGEETPGREIFRIRQLNYVDHPRERLPVYHFAFFVQG